MDGAAALSTLFHCEIFHPLFYQVSKIKRKKEEKKGEEKLLSFAAFIATLFERVFMCFTCEHELELE